MDIEAPNHSFGAKEVIELQARKTGALFEFSCQAGARLAVTGYGPKADHLAGLPAYLLDRAS